MTTKADMRVLLPVPLFCALAVCLYGFTTTFEPMEPGRQLTWRIVYASGSLLSLLLLALLLAASIRADTRQRPR